MVAGLEDLFLAVEGKGSAVFADNGVCQKAGGGEAAVLQTRGQGSGQRCQVRIGAMDVGAADEAAARVAGQLIVQLLADFLTDLPPVYRTLFDSFRVNDFFDDGQVFWKTGRVAGRALGAWDGRQSNGLLWGGSNGLGLRAAKTT